jgi:8-oxo-dGTP diphosphatase
VEDVRDPEPQWTRAGAYVLCRDDVGRILLTRFYTKGQTDSGVWTMPGGGMKWGETPEQTALRELDEETGLRAHLGPVVGVFSHWFTATESIHGEAGCLLGVVYESSELMGDLRTAFHDGTTDAAAWFSLEEVLSLPRAPLVDFVLDRVR